MPALLLSTFYNKNATLRSVIIVIKLLCMYVCVEINTLKSFYVCDVFARMLVMEWQQSCILPASVHEELYKKT